MAGSRKRQAVTGCSNVPDIAHIEGIIMTIFFKLPVTSLVLCEQVVKQWYEIIRKPQFPRLHFNSNLENNKVILHLVPRRTRSSPVLHLVDKDAKIRPYTTLRKLGRKVTPDIISSFNGLLCCTTLTGNRIFIINPATRKLLRVPFGSVSMMPITIGVIFDVDPTKYKIVRFYSYERFDYREKYYSCEVYCTIRDSWTHVGHDLPCPLGSGPFNFLPSHKCVGGRMYWFVWKEPQREIDYILSLGMDEKIKRIELPETDGAPSYLFDVFTFFINYRGHLGIFYLEEKEGLAGIYSLINPDTSYWKLVTFTKFDTNGPLGGINAIVEIGNELLFVLSLNSDDYYHFRYLNLDTMQWRDAETGFVKRGVFRPQRLLSQQWVARAFPFNDSFFKCKGEI